MDARSTRASQNHARRTSRRTSLRAWLSALTHLSPINTRRWENFKANRRGFWSLWIFLV